MIAFSRRHAGTIGLIFDDPLTFALTDPAEALFVTGIGQVCERAGVGLALISVGPHEELIRRTLVDGFICHCDIEGTSGSTSRSGATYPSSSLTGPRDRMPATSGYGTVTAPPQRPGTLPTSDTAGWPC